jgi:Domain of unknown function (DUF222)/HNH endonuclease
MDGGLPDVSLSLEELESQITELAGQLNAANYRWLTLIAEYDRRQGWNDGALHSCAHWLNFKCGLNLGAAREKVRVAHALGDVPKIAAAMARGELSYSKVRALTRVATPATEDTLLMIALHGTAYHVENLVRQFRRALQAEELTRDAQQQATRSVRFWYDTDGSLVLRARLPALSGALVVKALETALDDGVAEPPECYAARRADALARVAETYLSGAGGSTADSHQVVIHVDAETLKDQEPGRCHIDEGPSLPVATVRRLTCDASLVRLTETRDGEPLDVGRKTRTIPPAIRRALHSRDAGCCFPGCTYRRYLDAHHVEHWAEGGATRLSNLVTLCRAHHRLVHEGGATVEAIAGGGWRFLRTDGSEYRNVAEESTQHDWTDLYVAIDADAAATRWRGERMDYELGVWTLCHQAAKDVSAETSL